MQLPDLFLFFNNQVSPFCGHKFFGRSAGEWLDMVEWIVTYFDVRENPFGDIQRHTAKLLVADVRFAVCHATFFPWVSQ